MFYAEYTPIDTKMGDVGMNQYYRFAKDKIVCAGFIEDKNWIINGWIVPLKLFSFKIVNSHKTGITTLSLKTYHDKKIIFTSYAHDEKEAIKIIIHHLKSIAAASKNRNDEINAMFNKH